MGLEKYTFSVLEKQTDLRKSVMFHVNDCLQFTNSKYFC